MFKCDICDKKFDNASKLGGHKSSHSRVKKTKIVKCLNCDVEMSLITSSNQKYCSLDCVYSHRRSLKGNSKMVMYNGDIINITYDEVMKIKNNIKYCEICGKEEPLDKNGKRKSLALDHNHKTKEFRGFLCSSCNRNLGWFENYRNHIENYLS